MKHIHQKSATRSVILLVFPQTFADYFSMTPGGLPVLGDTATPLRGLGCHLHPVLAGAHWAAEAPLTAKPADALTEQHRRQRTHQLSAESAPNRTLLQACSGDHQLKPLR
jgi:hypothetical protein